MDTATLQIGEMIKMMPRAAYMVLLLSSFWICRAQEATTSIKEDSVWIEKRIAELQPTEAVRAFDRIGWATDILTAEAMAKKNNRPVFLFTHDGHMSTGRC